MKHFFLFGILLVSFSAFGQSKKEIKNNKIKSIAVWQADVENGKTVTYKDSYEEFDKQGRSILKIEYNKEGKIKRKKTAKFDSFNNKIEVTEFDLKDSINIKKTFKYNALKDKTEETEYNSAGEVIKKTTFKYDDNGNKVSEITNNATGNVIKKVDFKYNEKNIKVEKHNYKGANKLESVRKWVYEYF